VRASVSPVVAGGSLLGLVVLAALLAPWLTQDPAQIDLDSVLRPPSSAHLLGTDGLGRDVGARLLHGARTSLLIGFATGALSLLLGLPLGAAAGYFGGAVDSAASRLIESVMCFPGLVVAIALLSVGPPWLLALSEPVRIAIALGLIGWTPAARYMRGEFRRLRGSDAVIAARAAGAGHPRIILRHLLPRSLAPVVVSLAFGVGSAALAEAALSFVGVGISPPRASWGELLGQALHQAGRAWWLAVFPGGALFLLVLGCNRLGDGIRDRLDPIRPA